MSLDMFKEGFIQFLIREDEREKQEAVARTKKAARDAAEEQGIGE